MFLSAPCLQKAGILYRNCTTTGKNSAARLALMCHFWVPSRTRAPGCLFAWVLEKESQHFGVLFVLGWSLLSSVLSSTSLSKAPAKGGGRAVPATAGHQVPKPRQVKRCGSHSLACRLIQAGKRFLTDNTRFLFLALFPPPRLFCQTSHLKRIQKTVMET